MNNLAQYLAYTQPRSGQSQISPLAMSLINQRVTSPWQALGNIALMAADKYRTSQDQKNNASSIAEMLAGAPVTQQAMGAGGSHPGGGVTTQANPEYDRLYQLLMDSPELAPFFQAQALEKQFPDLFAEDPAAGAGPEFKVWGNNAAWVDPQSQNIEWVTGGPQAASGGQRSAAPAASPAASAGAPTPAAPPSATTPQGGRPMTEVAAKANEFSSYINRGGQTIDGLISGGFKPGMMTMLAEPSADFFGMLANQVLSPEEQQYWQAVREITAGVLRRETGAAFSSDEIKDVIARYIPLPGDDAEAIKQKQGARNGVMNTMRSSAGLAPIEPAGGGTVTTPSGNQIPNMKAPPVDPSMYPDGTVYESDDGTKFVIQDGQWWATD